MPTYEYACRDCGKQLEVVQAFTDDALTECPHCGGSLRKVFGSVGISFKGSGFYKNDSRSQTSSSSAGKSSESGSEKADSGGSGDKTSSGDKSASSGSGGETKSGDSGSSSTTSSGSAGKDSQKAS